MKKLIFLMFALLLVSKMYAGQQLAGPDKFVQFYVPLLDSRENANALSEFLKSKDGVKMCRVDFTGKTIYVIFNSDSGLTKQQFESFLTEKGYTATCSNEGVHGVDPFVQFNADECSPKK